LDRSCSSVVSSDVDADVHLARTQNRKDADERKDSSDTPSHTSRNSGTFGDDHPENLVPRSTT
jgi:hypothetical protein